MKDRIILVLGKAGVGKTTFAKVGEHFYNYYHVEMAENLTYLEAFLYKLFLRKDHQFQPLQFNDAKVFYPNIKEEGLEFIKDAMFEWYKNNSIETHNGKPRNALQYLGTEIMRKNFGDDIHIIPIVNNIIRSSSKNIVVGSIRFKNEIEKLSVLAHRVSIAVVERKIELTENLDSHVSEQEWQTWIEENPDSHRSVLNFSTLSLFLGNAARFYESLEGQQ
jgi:hypothetical protein